MHSHTSPLKVFTSNSQRSVLAELAPKIERAIGRKLDVSYDPAQIMLHRIAGGESPDVVMLTKHAIDTLARDGRIDAASACDVGRCGVGVAVRAGSAKPDIASVDAFRRTLLEARSIAHTTEGASGIHFAKVVEQLGVAAEVKAKARVQPGGLVAMFVTRGDAELAIQQIPELLAVPGVDLAGPLPQALQAVSIVTAAVSAQSVQGDAANAFIEFLLTPEAARVLREKGFEAA